jgi:conjugative transposon TraN protein
MKKLALFIIFIPICWGGAKAQSSLSSLDNINVNEDVSSHLTFPETILYVDISTNKIAGDIPEGVNNIIRFKPISDDSIGFMQGEVLAVVTVVTERYKKQFKLTYSLARNATTSTSILLSDMDSYINPSVSMPRDVMYNYAWKVFQSKRKFHDVSQEDYKLRINLYNIYTIGEYFFIDVALQNSTNIQYDIDQIRFKIEDKKQTKATNFQQIEIEPVLTLFDKKTFKKAYRNVFVFKKFTFPDSKVFTVEIAEEQISGRTVTLKIDYQDVLNADNFKK